MKLFLKIAIIFPVILTPWIAQQGLTQTIEISKNELDRLQIKPNFILSNYQINSTFGEIHLSNLDPETQLNDTLNSELLTSASSLEDTQKSAVPAPDAKNISQLASDLQFQTQIEPEETQPILEEPEEAEPKNEPETGESSGGQSLAEKAQNPIASLISFPFQNNTNFGVGELDRTQNILNIQPVVPIDLSDDWLLVSRTIFPIVYQPALTQTQYSHFGLGDINPQLFFVPKTQSKITWGVGSVFLLPTATDKSLGTGKWGIGPTAVIVVTEAPWVVGALANNIWSVAGDSDRPDVSQFLLQPFINYNLPNGWYLVSAPIITANWNASSGNKWIVPIGGGVGRLFKIGAQPINATLQAYWNVETPENGPDWTLRTQFQLLFPKGQ